MVLDGNMDGHFSVDCVFALQFDLHVLFCSGIFPCAYVEKVALVHILLAT